MTTKLSPLYSTLSEVVDLAKCLQQTATSGEVQDYWSVGRQAIADRLVEQVNQLWSLTEPFFDATPPEEELKTLD
uniref:Uncharacterized protein n=1 Tax=Cyanothece sp. (strain PCC 7425 / ATCC 29141) TaxID=395961 RepID=B8HMV2_CYAP4